MQYVHLMESQSRGHKSKYGQREQAHPRRLTWRWWWQVGSLERTIKVTPLLGEAETKIRSDIKWYSRASENWMSVCLLHFPSSFSTFNRVTIATCLRCAKVFSVLLITGADIQNSSGNWKHRRARDSMYWVSATIDALNMGPSHRIRTIYIKSRINIQNYDWAFF